MDSPWLGGCRLFPGTVPHHPHSALLRQPCLRVAPILCSPDQSEGSGAQRGIEGRLAAGGPAELTAWPWLYVGISSQVPVQRGWFGQSAGSPF